MKFYSIASQKIHINLWSQEVWYDVILSKQRIWRADAASHYNIFMSKYICSSVCPLLTTKSTVCI